VDWVQLRLFSFVLYPSILYKQIMANYEIFEIKEMLKKTGIRAGA
jgi:hypothetical protein